MVGRRLFLLVLPLLLGCGGQSPHDVARNMPVTQTPAAGEPPVVERKIVYTATIDLAVRDLPKMQAEMTSLIGSVGGYAATFREEKTPGGQPAGRWVIRLPAAKFQQFTEDVLKLGVVITQQTDAQDVTEQYIDLAARLSNKQRMEQRVLKLMEERKAEIREVLDMEAQLARIREEVETLEGKMRYLSDRVAMTTVTITAQQNAAYFPTAPPSFADKAANTLGESLAAMRELGEGIVLALIAVGPWLLIGLLLLGTPLAISVRWRQVVTE